MAFTETPTQKYTVEEFLQMEEKAATKHYFINGKIIPMPGATPRHNLIAANVLTELNNQLRTNDKEYYVLNSDSQIFIPKLQNFVYPDAVVVCEQIALYPGSTTVITNPLLIVEVRSPYTSQHNRNNKFFDYKRIPSFKEYLLVEQDFPLITTVLRTAEHLWEDADAEGIEAILYLNSIDFTLNLQDIYRGIKF